MPLFHGAVGVGRDLWGSSSPILCVTSI